MGEIVGAAIFGHQPAIMAPAQMRTAMGQGRDTTLVEPGMATVARGTRRLRCRYLRHLRHPLVHDDRAHRRGRRELSGHLHLRRAAAADRRLRLQLSGRSAPRRDAHRRDAASVACGTSNATNPHIGTHYPTLNVVHYLHRGERCAQRRRLSDRPGAQLPRLRRVLGEAVRRTPNIRVALIGSGGMSHTFWPMDTILDHASFRPEDVISPEARAFDERIVDLWREGDHAAVLDLYPEYRRFHPEGFFGHYLMLAGALGGRDCRAPGAQLSEYENAVGTGQIHVWFDVAR